MKTRILPQVLFVPHDKFPGVEMGAVVGTDLSQEYRASLVKILPGGEILPHIHEMLEVAYIISGKGELLLNGEYHPLNAGETMYAPAGNLHGIRNSGEEPVMLFATFPNCKK